MKEYDFVRYIEARKKGGFGWLKRFNEETCGDFGAGNYAYLSGRYSAMLAEVISLVGEDRLLELARTQESIDPDVRARE